MKAVVEAPKAAYPAMKSPKVFLLVLVLVQHMVPDGCYHLPPHFLLTQQRQLHCLQVPSSCRERSLFGLAR